MINKYIIEYAINALLRQGYKSFFIVFVFTLLTFLLTSVFFITNSMKYELGSTADALPEIMIQDLKGGRHSDIDVSLVEKILALKGVSDAVARVWGYYYFENAGVYFSLVGVDTFEEQYSGTLSKIVSEFEASDTLSSSMIIGAGVRDIMTKSYYKEYFNFIKPDGSIKKVNIAGVFDTDTALESNDMIVMSKDNIREIFDMPQDKATDITVKVANPEEIATIVSKLELMFPTARVLSKDDIKISYENIFNYKSGIFLALFIISIFTFFIIIYDKASGLSSEEKKEIGILKALGWRIEDVLKEKFYESFILSLFSYFLGVFLALGFVYIFQAPLLRDIFIGYSDLKPSFELPFIFDLQTLALVFFLSVPVYIAATIIPSWKTATLEADEVIR
ncbi:FtsX-like permease family protein [bacterium]|nr:FtsX-like permease family protein [bacterium]MBU1991344.1 FtsX-like permease family protein [bacterium]